jgi:hypothetical protein
MEELKRISRVYANEEPPQSSKKQAPVSKPKVSKASIIIAAGIKKGSKAFDILSQTNDTNSVISKLQKYKTFLDSRTGPNNKKRNLSSLALLIYRRSNVSGLTMAQTLNFVLNTKRNLNNYDALAKKLLSESTGRTLFPQAFNSSTPKNVKLRTEAEWSELQDAARHWGTGSWQASRSGGVLETIAVASAAAGSGVKVVYWGDPVDFPGSEKTSVTYRFGVDDRTLIEHLDKSPKKKLLFLKARISLKKLKEEENNLNRQQAWLAAILNNSTRASIAALKKTPGYKNLMKLQGKSAENSRWKGYSFVEPDGIFMKREPDGSLKIYILEFKITTGKAEGVPAEAYQLAKARRSLLFSFPDATIKNYFVAWQFGTQGNAITNFYDPYELQNGTSAPNQANSNYVRQNEWSKKFRNNLGSEYFVRKLGPARFQKITGISSDSVENILRGIRYLNVKNIASKMNSTLRHLPGPSAPPPIVGHTRNSNLLQKLRNQAQASRTRSGNCASRYTNEPARKIACKNLNAFNSDNITNIVRSAKFSEPWINLTNATPAQKAAFAKALNEKRVKPLETNNPTYAAHQKYLQRLQAWVNRLNDPVEYNKISKNTNSRIQWLRNLKGLNVKGKSDKNTIILRVMQNASLLNPAIVPQLVNVLKETNSNQQTWASIFDPVIERQNIAGALIAKRGKNRTLGPAGNAYINSR